MKSTPAQVVAQFLVLKGEAFRPPGLGSKWPITTWLMPPDGGNYLTVYDTGSTNFGRESREGKPIEAPTVQVRVRGVDYAQGWDKARLIRDLFNKVGIPTARGGFGFVPVQLTLPVGTETITIQAAHASVVNFIGQEEKGNRQLFTLNVQLSLSEA